MHRPLEQTLKESHAQIFDASELPAGRLFKKYFAGEPPFGRGSSKRRGIALHGALNELQLSSGR